MQSISERIQLFNIILLANILCVVFWRELHVYDSNYDKRKSTNFQILPNTCYEIGEKIKVKRCTVQKVFTQVLLKFRILFVKENETTITDIKKLAPRKVKYFTLPDYPPWQYLSV